MGKFGHTLVYNDTLIQKKEAHAPEHFVISARASKKEMRRGVLPVIRDTVVLSDLRSARLNVAVKAAFSSNTMQVVQCCLSSILTVLCGGHAGFTL